MEGALTATGVRSVLWFSLVAATMASGCATITESVEMKANPAGNDRVKSDVVEGSLRYAAVLRTIDQSIVASLKQSEDCQTTRTQRVHRTQVTKRTITGGFQPWLSLTIGGVLTGAGVFAVVRQATATGMPSSTTSSPDTLLLSGLLSGAGGLVMLTIGIIDLIRARDSEEDLGVVNGSTSTETTECNVGPVPETSPVRIQLGRTQLKTYPVDGRATFKMHDVPPSDLPLARQELTLSVRQTPVAVVFTERERKELEKQLGQDPTSALSTEAAGRRAKECAAAYEDAKKIVLSASSTDSQQDQAIASWERARSTCGALWSSEAEGQHMTALGVIGIPTLRRIEAASSALSSRGKQLDKKPSVAAAADFEAALKAAGDTMSRCNSLSQLLKELEHPCEGLTRTIVAAQATLNAHSDEVDQLRAAAAEREMKLREAAAARAWRTHFAKCRTLAGAQEKMNQLDLRGQCAGECLKAAEKMQDEADRLAAFQADAPANEALLQTLRNECSSAGCSSCP